MTFILADAGQWIAKVETQRGNPIDSTTRSVYRAETWHDAHDALSKALMIPVRWPFKPK